MIIDKIDYSRVQKLGGKHLQHRLDDSAMVGEKSTDKILHNMLTSCDHLLSMFYLLLTILVIFSVFI